MKDIEMYSDFFTKAFRLATIAHMKQKDKGGQPYILHPIAVSELCKTPKAKIVAILHDVVEDSSTTIEEIEKEIPDKEIIDAIRLLTKPPKTMSFSYSEYLDQIKKSPIAREVKIADLTHNSDLSRLKTIKEADKTRYLKYQKSILFLKHDYIKTYEE
jgi:(p)ppGpp synthase/HD superfamily hydrolase